MKRFTILLGLAVLFLAPVVLADVPKLINFQGILRDGSGNPVADAVYVIRFRIYDDSTAGANLWEEFDDVQTADGFFNVRLGDTTDLPDGLFEGSVNRFVGVKVGGDPEAAPRTRLIPVPFAFHTLKSDSAATASVALDLTCTGCVSASDVDAAQVQRRVTGTAPVSEYIIGINQDGSVVTAVDQGSGGPFLPLAGGTMTGAIANTGNPTITMGKGNFGSANTNAGINAFVAGESNTASGNYATVGGGQNDTAGGNWSKVGGGFGNAATGTSATVSGGTANRGSGFYTTVGGGEFNQATFNFATVGGGYSNIASAVYSTVAGGRDDTASGDFATVPGGRMNVASGLYSFAAGRRAKALHSGTFVWGDGTDADFASTATNQFLIRAANVGIGLNNPTKKLEVAGSIKVGTNDTVFSSNISSNSPLSLQAPAGTTRMFISDASGNVGIGTSTPTSNLHIFQDVNNSVGLRIDNPNVGGAAQERIDFGSSGLASLTVFGGSNGMSIVNNRTSGLIDFETGGTTRVRIANNGRVAIGTVSQQNTLDVGGNAAIGASFAGTGAPANGLLVEGNVGIGTTSPTTRLQVVGGQISADAGTPAAPGYAFAGDLNTGFYGFGDFLSFITGGTQRGYIAPDGRFVMESRAQIGTTTTFGDPSTLYVQGSIATDNTTVVGPTTLTSSRSVVLVNTGATTITLPLAALAPGRQYTIKKISAAAGIVVVDGAGAETIDGAATHSLTLQYEYVTIVSNGASWFVVADN